MRVFHDSRDIRYRDPFGAVPVGTAVTLTLDVAESPGAKAVVRTWVDGVGEALHDMELAGQGENGELLFGATLAPKAAGNVWYQFVITDVEGRIWRYGARNGRLGGDGQLVGWEPPSFRLHVYDENAPAPAWYEPIGSYLYDGGACHDLAEVAATLCENYPVGACRTVAPWDVGDAAPAPASLPDMAAALGNLEPGACSWFAADEDVFGLWREGDGSSMLCVLANASVATARDVAVPLVGEAVCELVCGHAVRVVEAAQAGKRARALFPDAGRFALVSLQAASLLVLHFHDTLRLAKPMQPGLGVLAHITSLPTDDGRPGTLGAPARRFVDCLAGAGVRYWQVLPVNPTDEYGSPYAGVSAFAGNVRLLEGGHPATADDLAALEGDDAYARFCAREADWLEPYACFMAIRAKVGEGITWQEWPSEYRRYSAGLPKTDAQLENAAEEVRRTQYLFERQWKELRAYANERGVALIGDMPMYVSADSADVWAHPGLFQLNAGGEPLALAGCAPDAFAAEGQVWGNPLYDWDAMREDGYAWWMRRLERAFGVYDYLRLDHFIGFSRYFSIPVGQKASLGTYRLGPGFALFSALHERFGVLPIIAEDLGLVTPRVRALVADCGFPGMDVIQFADGGDPLSGYVARPEKIVYTGTHDNQTLRGYVESRYPGMDASEATGRLIASALRQPTPVCVVPLQDVLGLGDEARMNVPGVAEGNWAWQAAAGDVEAAARRLKELVSARP